MDRAYARYLLRPHELFARSYAQFIATESQAPAFAGEMHRLRVAREGIVSYPELWDDSDFTRVAEAFRSVIPETAMAEISKQLSFEEAVREIMSRVSCTEDRAR